MKSRSGIRTGLIITIFLLATVLVILLANLLPLLAETSAPRRPEPALRQEVTSAVALSDAGLRAADRARAWTEDAELVRAEAAWYVTPGWERLDMPPVAWAFLYYSPTSGELATAIVDDGEVLWGPPVPIPVQPRPIASFPPEWGADLAWLAFLASEGKGFLQAHPAAQVTFRLQMQDGVLAWNISAYDEDEYISMGVDATTGTILPNRE